MSFSVKQATDPVVSRDRTKPASAAPSEADDSWFDRQKTRPRIRTRTEDRRTPDPDAPVRGPASRPDSRSHPRYSLDEPVVVEVGSWTDLVALYTEDISQGGMFIRTHAPPPRAEQVAIQLLLPGGIGTMDLRGVVVHVIAVDQAHAQQRAPGFGVRFTNLTAGRRRALLSIVERARVEANLPVAEPSPWQTIAHQRVESSATSTQGQRQRAREIRDELALRQIQDDHEVLGLDPNPTRAQVEGAFAELTARWRPRIVDDREAPELRRMAAELYQCIEQAHARLLEATAKAPVAAPSNVPRRRKAAKPITRAYASGPAASTRPASPSPRDHDYAAMIQRAMDLVAREEFGEATQVLSLALMHKSDPKIEILRYLVLARDAIAKHDTARARGHYESVLALDPNHSVARIELLMLESAGDPRRGTDSDA